MGIADLVPGISGGTVAFMTGIYTRLIAALSQFNPALLLRLRREGIKQVWSAIDGNFVVALFGGILTSIALFAGLISHLLQHYPLFVWAAFFGLVAGSIWYLLRSLPKGQPLLYGLVLLGALVAWFIVELQPVGIEPSFLYIVFCGAIAISAMVLPGISGSFILLLLGVYPVLLAAVNEAAVAPLMAFVIGAVVGLMTVSRILKALLARFYFATVAVLTGFLVGSIKALWPWRLAAEKGQALTLVSPFEYEQLAQQPAQLIWVALCMLVGALLVIGLTLVAEKSGRAHT